MAEYQIQPSPRRSGYRVGVQAAGFGESSWVPSLQFGGASTNMLYQRQIGAWMRQGHLVQVWFDIVLTAVGTATGAASIDGLPFVASNLGYSTVGAINLAFWTSMATSFVVLGVLPSGGNRLLAVHGASAAATALSVRSHADFSDSSRLAANLTYWTDD